MKFKKTMIAAAVLAQSTIAFGANMFIDVGTNQYDLDAPIPAGIGTAVDANTQTGIFNEFGFSQFLATSFYQANEAGESGGSIGDIFGSFFDTNDPARLADFGIPTGSILNIDGDPVNGPGGADEFFAPAAGIGGSTGPQDDLDALSPLVPPIAADAEGFQQTWDLRASIEFEGNLLAGGPDYTAGRLEVFFNDFTNDANDMLAFAADFASFTLVDADLVVNFNIDTAATTAGFLFIEDEPGSGTFSDAALGGTIRLDTNIDPAIPTSDQLALLLDSADGDTPYLVRQTFLDGSFTAEPVPVPATLALLGVGLLGASVSRKRKV